jgi:phosphoribosylformylglycinamidine synthase
MLSESQERMIFVIHPEDEDQLIEIFDKYELPRAVIGTVTGTGRFEVIDNGEIIADIPTGMLSDPPTIERECAIDHLSTDDITGVQLEKIGIKNPIVKEGDLKQTLLNVLSSQNVASKEWVYRQYDQEVQIRTVVKPGDDAAVIRVDDETAFTITSDCNSSHTKLNPYHGGAGAVAEAIRNVVSMGSEPLCIVDCLNFGNPEKPHIFKQFTDCVQGMADVANRYQTPVISGNVSFYNETEGVTINPSPAVGVAGLIKIKDVKTFEFKGEGDKIIIIGETNPELSGSEYQKLILGKVEGQPPLVNIEDEYKNAMAVLNLIREDSENNVTAVHDCSTGGIGVALSEMALSGDLGAEINLSWVPASEELDDFELLFSESHGRFIVTVKEKALEEIMDKLEVPAAVVGTVKGDSLVINGSLKIPLSEIRDTYHGVIEKYMA